MMDQWWLLPMWLFITGSCFGAESSSPCPANQFLHPNEICCEFCGIGTYMLKPCQVPGSNPLCPPCKTETCMEKEQHNMTTCKQCSVCDPESEVETRKCDIFNNRQCFCREGFQRKGNKCLKEEYIGETKIDLPSNERTRWILIPLSIGLLIIGIFILGVRRYCHKAFFTKNAIQPKAHDIVKRCNSSEPFLRQNNTSIISGTSDERTVSNERLESGLHPKIHVETLISESVSSTSEIPSVTFNTVIPRTENSDGLRQRSSQSNSRNLNPRSCHTSSSTSMLQEETKGLENTDMDLRNLKTQNGRTLSLDRNSAYPQISISQDLRAVTVKETENSDPKHADRFDFHPQVLSAESFSTGRHYWEIDVFESL